MSPQGLRHLRSRGQHGNDDDGMSAARRHGTSATPLFADRTRPISLHLAASTVHVSDLPPSVAPHPTTKFEGDSVLIYIGPRAKSD